MSQVETTVGAQTAAPTTDAPPAAPPKKPRKAGCGCLFPALILVGVLGFAPQILTMTTLRHQVPGMLISALPPGVVIGSATAGWMSPIQLNDIVIPDDQGKPNLKLKHVTLSRSLWDFVQSADDLGTIVVDKPELNLIVDQGSSNYDHIIGRLVGKRGSGKRKLIDLKLVDGTVLIREGQLAAPNQPPIPKQTDPQTDQTATSETDSGSTVKTPAEQEVRAIPDTIARLEIQEAAFRSQAAGDEELFAKIKATLREPLVDQPFSAELSWNLPDGEVAGVGSGRLTADVPSIPLAVLSPWLSPLTRGRDVTGISAFKTRVEAMPSERELLLGVLVEIPHLDLNLAPDAEHPQPFRWTGDQLRLVAEGQGDLLGQKITIENAQLRTPLVNADIRGTVNDLPGTVRCQLTGECNLDPQDLLRVMPAEWQEHVQIQGLKLGQFQVQGDLLPIAEVKGASPSEPMNTEKNTTPLQVSAEVAWESGNVMGFQSNNALIRVNWSGSTLSLNPNHLPINGGEWVASPRIEFGPDGRTLVFDGGPVFENVSFTREMSETWLKYVSPILGQATSIEGRFSLSASPTRIGLSAPWPGQMTGALDIESAKVGPGPMTRQIVEGVGAIQTMAGRQPVGAEDWMVVEQQRVPFAFAEGRVHHKDLHLNIGDLVVNSAGSVGLDETLDLQMTVPIPDRWTEGKPLLAGLKGEVIPLSMQGTLDHPELDRQSLAEFGRRIGFKSAGGLLEQLIQKRMEKKAKGELPSQRPKTRPPK